MTKYQISAPLFWGYSVHLSPDDFEKVEDIIAVVKCSLRCELQALNLVELVEKLDPLELRIHGDTSLDVVYLCDHSHN